MGDFPIFRAVQTFNIVAYKYQKSILNQSFSLLFSFFLIKEISSIQPIPDSTTIENFIKHNILQTFA